MPNTDGNDAQNRIIAKQMFDAFAAEQEARANTEGARADERRRLFLGSVPAWSACIIAVGSVIWNAAVVSGDISENRRRIEQVETDQKRQGETERGVIERMARIEAKLDIVLEGKSL